MECRELTERVVDRVTGQIGPDAERDLEAHLSACTACRAEAAAVGRAWAFLGEDPGVEPTAEFRRASRELLEEEMIRARVREFRPRPRAARWAAQAAALLVAGGLGWFAAAELPRGGETPVVADSRVAPVPNLQSNPRLSNLSFERGTGDRLGIGFDMTTRHTVEGTASDPEVSQLLAYLLSRNAENAGEKSRAIELLQEHYGAGAESASPDIIAALTNTLRRDRNPGVRKKAADALSGMRMTPEIRAAFLEALSKDDNPAVRLVAIERLAAAAKESPDARTIQSLREKAVDPSENGFVRARAASALKTMEF